MLGADPMGLTDEGGDNDASAAESACPRLGRDAVPPRHSWSTWWFVRTYLQALGEVSDLESLGLGRWERITF